MTEADSGLVLWSLAHGSDKPLLSSISMHSLTGIGVATSTLQYSNGRLVARVDANGNPVLYKGVNLSFDPENRMTAYGNTLTAGYNGDGLRAWKQTASGRRYFLYDGEELVCELDAAGSPVAGVVFGANGLIVYGGYICQFDPQGNATHLLDDDGLVVAHLAYDAWSQRMFSKNPTPYGYKGQWGYYTDGETGLVLLTHRYLERVTGKFLTGDMIILADQRYTTYRTMLSRLHKADIL